MHAISTVATELSRKLLHSGRLILAYSACHTTCTAIPLTMPHNSQPPPSTNAKKNVFDYILWSMEWPMSKENNIIKYYNRFLDLTEPLFDSHWLDDKEHNKLFWYGFHPEDCTMLLCRLRSENPHQRSGICFTLQQVLHTRCNIFSQRPGDLQKELRDAVEQYPLPRGPHNYQYATERGPSLCKYQAKEFVQNLEDKVIYHRELA
jgi:hypothetical protein